MAIAKFDDGLTDNPKIIAAGPLAGWLWFCGVLYCRRGLTNGFIPKAVVPRIGAGISSPYKYASKLVEVGLWHIAVGGYDVHDFLVWNPSKDKIEDLRKADRERKHGKQSSSPVRLESERNPKREANSTALLFAGAGAKTEKENAYVEEKGKELEAFSEKSARETTLAPTEVVTIAPGNPHSRPTNLVNGAEQLKHAQHAWCSWPARDGFCVTWNYHNQVISRSLKTGTEVLTFYARTMAEMEGIPIGEPLFTFWDNKVNAWLGSATSKASAPSPHTRGNATVAALHRVLAARAGG